MATEDVTQKNSLDAAISRTESDLNRILGWVRSAESRLALVLPLVHSHAWYFGGSRASGEPMDRCRWYCRVLRRSSAFSKHCLFGMCVFPKDERTEGVYHLFRRHHDEGIASVQSGCQISDIRGVF
jgi:hypothetical protein